MTVRSVRTWCTAVALTAALPTLLGAQQAPSLHFGAQVRPRLEVRTPVQESRDVFTSMRVRASLEARLEGGVKLFAQLQDVRLFGEEIHTLSDYRADNLDLHQGFLELGSVPLVGGSLRVGRQEMAFGEQRLIGTVDWAQQGRSFDGGRYTSRGFGGLTVDLFAMKLHESTSPNHPFDGELYGAWADRELGGGGSLGAWGLVTTDNRPAGTDEVTVSNATLTLWYDYLSGDGSPLDGEVRVFNTLFATNHLYYGLADYFTDIPVHTGGLGLQDAAVKLALTPSPRTGINVDLHAFRTAQPGSLSTRELANELDLTLTYRQSPALTVTSGYSFVQARDGIKELERLDRNAQWAFIMLNASL